MEMEDFNYRGFHIQGQSFKNENEKWVPQAKIIHPDGETVHPEEAPLTWSREFETEQEANDFALDSAQVYIDQEY